MLGKPSWMMCALGMLLFRNLYDVFAGHAAKSLIFTQAIAFSLPHPLYKPLLF
jgi:hypothetical protein